MLQQTTYSRQGQNGPIVVTLFKPDTPTKEMVSGLLSEGNITTTNLEGPLAGKQLSDLLSSMHSMGVYVNIHTTQYPDGEIRGQILEQQKAVTHSGSPLLIVAGPGGGKTRVIIERILYLIRSGLKPSEVLYTCRN